MLLDSAYPQVTELRDESEALEMLAQTYTVTDSDSYRSAADELKRVKSLLSQAETVRKEITRPMDEAKARVMALFKPITERLEATERCLKGLMADFERSERERLAEVERQRRALMEAEQARLRAEAEAAREQGNELEAEILEETALVMPSPAPLEAERPSGISVQTRWSAEVVDLRALLQGVLDGVIPLEAVTPNQTFLNGAARSLKAALNWPGVRAVARDVMAAR